MWGLASVTTFEAYLFLPTYTYLICIYIWFQTPGFLTTARYFFFSHPIYYSYGFLRLVIAYHLNLTKSPNRELLKISSCFYCHLHSHHPLHWYQNVHFKMQNWTSPYHSFMLSLALHGIHACAHYAHSVLSAAILCLPRSHPQGCLDPLAHALSQNSSSYYSSKLKLKLNSSLAACPNASQTHETGAGGKERGLCKCRPPEKIENSCPQKPILFIGFIFFFYF